MLFCICLGEVPVPDRSAHFGCEDEAAEHEVGGREGGEADSRCMHWAPARAQDRAGFEQEEEAAYSRVLPGTVEGITCSNKTLSAASRVN